MNEIILPDRMEFKLRNWKQSAAYREVNKVTYWNSSSRPEELENIEEYIPYICYDSSSSVFIPANRDGNPIMPGSFQDYGKYEIWPEKGKCLSNTLEGIRTRNQILEIAKKLAETNLEALVAEQLAAAVILWSLQKGHLKPNIFVIKTPIQIQREQKEQTHVHLAGFYYGGEIKADGFREKWRGL